MPIALTTNVVLQAFGDEWGSMKRELVIKQEDTCIVGSAKYMWCTPHWYGLVQFVCCNAPGIDGKVPPKLSLTTSLGLKELMKLRNEAAWPATTAINVGSQLFDAVEAPPTKRARKQTEEAPATLDVLIPGVANSGPRLVKMKRPAHPCERLAIPIEPAAIEHVLLYIRMGGFDVSMKTKEGMQGKPVGVWFNKQRNVWMVPNSDGKGSKCFKTLAEASAVAAPPPLGDLECPATQLDTLRL